MSKWYPCIYCTEDLHCTKYSVDGVESWCVLGPCTAETPSNGDKMRRMTDEDLAEKIGESIDCEVCKTMHHSENDECPSKPHQSCVDFWLDWLKQEATNGETD